MDRIRAVQWAAIFVHLTVVTPLVGRILWRITTPETIASKFVFALFVLVTGILGVVRIGARVLGVQQHVELSARGINPSYELNTFELWVSQTYYGERLEAEKRMRGVR